MKLSEIVLLWCSDSFTKRVLIDFSCKNFSRTLNIDRIVIKPEKMDKAVQGLHAYVEKTLTSDIGTPVHDFLRIWKLGNSVQIPQKLTYLAPFLSKFRRYSQKKYFSYKS